MEDFVGKLVWAAVICAIVALVAAGIYAIVNNTFLPGVGTAMKNMFSFGG